MDGSKVLPAFLPVANAHQELPDRPGWRTVGVGRDAYLVSFILRLGGDFTTPSALLCVILHLLDYPSAAHDGRYLLNDPM